MFLPSILEQDKVTWDDDHEDDDNDHNLVHDDDDDDDDDLRKTMVDNAGTCISLAKPAFPMNSVFFFILVNLSSACTFLDVESLNLDQAGCTWQMA